VATNPAYDALSDQPGSSSPAATPESEIELLKRARNTLPADPVRALALTERCAEEYPRGAFAQERDFIAISALFRVGRRHEALSRAERFRSSYPRSVYLPQLERMLLAP
jgi:outer membrane protein assembly factor BamD (BamD/ComL family)